MTTKNADKFHNSLPRIVIVGGGAGGLELTTHLGRQLGKKRQAQIILVDQKLTHIWKPLWHEVAAGTLYYEENEISYLSHASRNHYRFEYGRLIGINRHQQTIQLAAVEDNQEIIIPAREIYYDILVLALGSESNDFGIPGAKEFCFTLDSQMQAKQFQQQFLKAEMELQYQENKKLDIAIIGAGATGVELAAELKDALMQTAQLGWQNIVADNIQISIIEAAERILPALPEKVSKKITENLLKQGVKIFIDQKVAEINADGIKTQSNLFIPASIKIWAAGIKAPEFLKNLGLENQRNNQIIVRPTLQTTVDDKIFAFGDCAYCLRDAHHHTVPARAQAAHQQADFLAKSIKNFQAGKKLPVFHYHDYGSLISLSRRQTVGYLMGKAKNFFFEGLMARFFYWSLYKKHQLILLGWWRVSLLTVSNWLTRRVKPRLKLH